MVSLVGEEFPKCFRLVRVRKFLLFQCEEDLVEGVREGREHVRDGFGLLENGRALVEGIGWAVATGKKVPSAKSKWPGFENVFDPMDYGSPSTAVRLDLARQRNAEPVWHPPQVFAPDGEYLCGAKFPEFFLDGDQRRIVGGTSMRGRIVGSEPSYEEGRFVKDLDDPWESVECYPIGNGMLSLVIARTTAGRCQQVRIFYLDGNKIKNGDLESTTAAGKALIDSSCGFCVERRRWCECSLMMRERMLPARPTSFSDWSQCIQYLRVVPLQGTVTTVTVTKGPMESSWSSVDFWRNAEGWSEALTRLIPSYLRRSWQPPRSISLRGIPSRNPNELCLSDSIPHLLELWQTSGDERPPKTRPKVECNECQRSFCRPGYLKTHMEIVHGRREKFTCNTCDGSFATQSNLNRHIRSVHQRIRNFCCCSKSFFSSTDYRRHLKRAHGDVTDHQQG